MSDRIEIKDDGYSVVIKPQGKGQVRLFVNDTDSITQKTISAIRQQQADIEALRVALDAANSKIADLEASLPSASNRDTNAARASLGEVRRMRIGEGGGYPEIGVVEVTKALDALVHAYGEINTLRAKLAEFTCPYCDGTGDVHSIDGEWRGECDCKASEPERLRRELKCTEETVGKHGFLGGPTLDACIDAMGSVARESRAKLREIGQMLIEQIGAHGPEDAVDTARRACNALDAANAKLAEIESRHVTPAQDRREPSDDECEQICESADVGFRPHASKATIGRAMFHAVKKWEDGL